MDQHTIQHLQQNPPTVKFKKLFVFDYGSDEEDQEDQEQDQGPSLTTLEALQG